MEWNTLLWLTAKTFYVAWTALVLWIGILIGRRSRP